MFLLSKRIVFVILTIGCFTSVSSQEMASSESNEISHHINVEVKGSVISLPDYNDKSITAHHTTKELKVDSKQKSELDFKWDNDRFNPYLGEEVHFPLAISFDDYEYQSPVDHEMVVTSHFGWRHGRAHKGIDIDLQTGDDVKSILAGKVRYAGYFGGYGNVVIVRHSNGLESLYAHLSSIEVEPNYIIGKGTILGKGGETGNARGSHLHMEIKYHGQCVNPEYLFDFTDLREIRTKSFLISKKWTNPRVHKSVCKSNIVIHKTINEISRSSIFQNRIHRVKKGDSLSQIAFRYGIAISEICRNNALKKNSELEIGQSVFIN